MIVLHNIDLNDFEIQNLKVHVTSVTPSSEQGQIYLDTTDTYLKYYNGTDWVSLRDDFLSTGDNISELINDAGYLTSYTETDPVFLSSPAGTITLTDISNWNTAYSWGDHSTAGYLTSYTEIDTLADVTARGNTTADAITTGGLVSNGDTTINGSVTELHSTQTEIADSFPTISSTTTGTPSSDAGFIVERGLEQNRGLKWNETTKTWQIQGDDGVYRNIATGLSDSYIFEQGIPAAVWSINHGLDSRPSVTVVDSAGSVVMGTIEYIDNFNLTITFNAAFSGEAYLN